MALGQSEWQLKVIINFTSIIGMGTLLLWPINLLTANNLYILVRRIYENVYQQVL